MLPVGQAVVLGDAGSRVVGFAGSYKEVPLSVADRMDLARMMSTRVSQCGETRTGKR